MPWLQDWESSGGERSLPLHSLQVQYLCGMHWQNKSSVGGIRVSDEIIVVERRNRGWEWGEEGVKIGNFVAIYFVLMVCGLNKDWIICWRWGFWVCFWRSWEWSSDISSFRFPFPFFVGLFPTSCLGLEWRYICGFLRLGIRRRRRCDAVCGRSFCRTSCTWCEFLCVACRRMECLAEIRS